VRATSDTSVGHLPTSSDERHRPSPIPILANLGHDPSRDPNRGRDHDPNRRDHRDLGHDRLRPVRWSLP
jgi:hypothetical protein